MCILSLEAIIKLTEVLYILEANMEPLYRKIMVVLNNTCGYRMAVDSFKVNMFATDEPFYLRTSQYIRTINRQSV